MTKSKAVWALLGVLLLMSAISAFALPVTYDGTVTVDNAVTTGVDIDVETNLETKSVTSDDGTFLVSASGDEGTTTDFYVWGALAESITQPAQASVTTVTINFTTLSNGASCTQNEACNSGRCCSGTCASSCGGGGGGSSGGGGDNDYIPTGDDDSYCNEDWDCTDWSACVNGEQTRDCTDANDCSEAYFKPGEERDCSETPSADDSDSGEEETTATTDSGAGDGEDDSSTGSAGILEQDEPEQGGPFSAITGALAGLNITGSPITLGVAGLGALLVLLGIGWYVFAPKRDDDE
ncbi:hypothetical protein ACFL0W_05565 [Nanoarchaeota archaeon]